MPSILILESNTPAIIESQKARNIPTGANSFMVAFQELSVPLEIELDFIVQAPYEQEFDAHILHDVDAVVLTGANVSWSIKDKEAMPIQNAAHAAFNSNLPIWGSCNGMQLAAYILGGDVGASQNGFECGMAKDIQLSNIGKSHPMMKNKPNNYVAPAMHRDEILALPEHAKLIASNKHSRVQAFTYEGNGVQFWGTQYHPEYSFQDIGRQLTESVGIFGEATNIAQNLTNIDNDFSAFEDMGYHKDMFSKTIRLLELKNWLQTIRT